MAHPPIRSHRTRLHRSVRHTGFIFLSSLVAVGVVGSPMAPAALAQALELPPPEGATMQGEEELPAPKSPSAAKKPANAHPAEHGASSKGEKAGTSAENAGEHAAAKDEVRAPGKGEEETAPTTKEHGAKAEERGAKAEESADHKSGEAHDSAPAADGAKPAKTENSAVKGSGLVWFAVTFVVLVVAVFVLT